MAVKLLAKSRLFNFYAFLTVLTLGAAIRGQQICWQLLPLLEFNLSPKEKIGRKCHDSVNFLMVLTLSPAVDSLANRAWGFCAFCT